MLHSSSSQRGSVAADESLVLKGNNNAAPIAAIIVSPPNDEALGELTSQDVPSLRFPAGSNVPAAPPPTLPRVQVPAFSFHDATSVRSHARGLLTAGFLVDAIIWCSWLCALTVSVGAYPYPRTPNYLFGASALIEIFVDIYPAIQLLVTNTESVSEGNYQLNLCLRALSTVLIDVSIQRTTISMVRLCGIAFASHMFGGHDGSPPMTRCLLLVVALFISFNAAAAPTMPNAVPDIFVMRPENKRPLVMYANTCLLVHSLLEVAVVTVVGMYARVAMQSTERDCAEFRVTVASVLTAASKMQFAAARRLLAVDVRGANTTRAGGVGPAGGGTNNRMPTTRTGGGNMNTTAAIMASVATTKNLSETVRSGGPPAPLSPPQQSASQSIGKSTQDGGMVRLPRVNVPLAAVRPLLDALLTNLETAAAFRPVDPLDRARGGNIIGSGPAGAGGGTGTGGGHSSARTTGAGSPSGISGGGGGGINPMGSISPGAHGHLNANYYGPHHGGAGGPYHGPVGNLSARPLAPSTQQNLTVFAMLTIKSQFDAAECVDEYGAPIIHAPVVPAWCWEHVRDVIQAHGGCIHEDESTMGVLLVVTWNVRTRHRTPAVEAAACLRRLDEDGVLGESSGGSRISSPSHDTGTADNSGDAPVADLIVAGAALTRAGRPNQNFLLDDVWREVDDVSAYAAMIRRIVVDEELCDDTVCTAADIYSSATHMMLLQDVESADRLLRPADPAERRIPLFTFASAAGPAGAGAAAMGQVLRAVAVRALVDAARGNWRGMQRTEEYVARLWAQPVPKTEEDVQVLTGLRWLFALGRKAVAAQQHPHQHYVQ